VKWIKQLWTNIRARRLKRRHWVFWDWTARKLFQAYLIGDTTREIYRHARMQAGLAGEAWQAAPILPESKPVDASPPDSQTGDN
jgi:hypothetical protein